MTTNLHILGDTWAADRKGRRRLATLQKVCDTFVPAVRAPAGAPPLGGFWVRTASDLGIHRAVAGWISTRLRPEDRDGLLQLVDLLGVTGFTRLPLRARQAILDNVRGTHDLARGFRGLEELAIGLFYGLADDGGPARGNPNPNWQVLGYPGPPRIEPPADRPQITPFVPPAGAETVTLDADVCIIGSGSGGGVIAGRLAAAGRSVVVLEAGEHFEEHSFPDTELEAYHRMYWRGTWSLSDDGKVKIGAGATLGGGSTVNWTNCVRPPAWVRQEWADEHGLKDVDTAAFEERLDAVAGRIQATQECSDPNGPNRRMQEGADALGWSWFCVERNTDPDTYDPATAGHMGFGDRSGSKQGTLNTYLLDAAGDGATIVVRCSARRVLADGGRARGVEAVMTAEGRQVPVTVNAPTVVVAAGALETPPVLLRSGLGGPAVGRYLRLHPVCALVGLYSEEQDAWWGPPHSRVVDEFAPMDGGYGFLIEGVQYGPGYFSGSLPWHGGRSHKVVMSGMSRAASLIGLVRDRGWGTVSIDADGESVVEYPLDDPSDIARMRTALESLARLHQAAGAKGLLDLTPGEQRVWRRGQDLDAFLARGHTIPYRLPYRVVGSAHQMGSARMGPDPATSVADPEGQLHDTAGVWIGDSSAFPTPTGANPMLTVMALAHRTADAILAAGP